MPRIQKNNNDKKDHSVRANENVFIRSILPQGEMLEMSEMAF